MNDIDALLKKIEPGQLWQIFTKNTYLILKIRYDKMELVYAAPRRILAPQIEGFCLNTKKSFINLSLLHNPDYWCRIA